MRWLTDTVALTKKKKVKIILFKKLFSVNKPGRRISECSIIHGHQVITAISIRLSIYSRVRAAFCRNWQNNLWLLCHMPHHHVSCTVSSKFGIHDTQCSCLMPPSLVLMILLGRNFALCMVLLHYTCVYYSCR